jgi:demethylmenaquinone methyltransferase/2-methoxy-6-polyprenyl-1,4-benzoquinol methylase
MPADIPPPETERFKPRAAREMAGMFDAVSPRYDLLNRLMTAGQDGAWRAAMWREVPDRAAVVLDLCTGNGVSLPGLVRPGRLVLGMDVSLGMLDQAADHYGGAGWAPRLACADAFHLPLRAHSVDVVTIAFGVRNLRPRLAALREMARVLRPGGTLVVLEAAAPGRGPLAPFHAFHLRRVIPLLGRLAHDPSAYEYLSRSIFEFGSGESFELDLTAAGFELTGSHSFMMGATRLWTARRADENPAGALRDMQSARPGTADRGDFTHRPAATGAEGRWWTAAQMLTAAALAAALVDALIEFIKLRDRLSLEPWQRTALLVLLGGGVVAFVARALVLLARLGRPGPRR